MPVLPWYQFHRLHWRANAAQRDRRICAILLDEDDDTVGKFRTGYIFRCNWMRHLEFLISEDCYARLSFLLTALFFLLAIALFFLTVLVFPPPFARTGFSGVEFVGTNQPTVRLDSARYFSPRAGHRLCSRSLNFAGTFHTCATRQPRPTCRDDSRDFRRRLPHTHTGHVSALIPFRIRGR